MNDTPFSPYHITQTAKAILDARANHPDSTFADLYDETFMPEDLRKAHKANDKAVMEAYGMWGKVKSESESSPGFSRCTRN